CQRHGNGPQLTF
nr:immunoglobulin light chain junction region [Macaca mulatta]